MKNHFPILLLVIACLQSCVFYVIEPQGPQQPDRQPWWYDTDTVKDNNNSGRTTDTVIVVVDNPVDDKTKNGDNEPQTSTDEETTSDFVPTTKYEVTTENGVLTYNVYLGWSIGKMETFEMIRDFSAYGGEIIFNIYTNYRSMSMYGFSKYDKDFYIFSSEPPYCGYSSFSMDKKGICKYKMIITENDTGVERSCSGYWSCNEGLYSAFHIVLYQNAK